MEYNSENPIYPKLTSYDSRRTQEIQHKLNTIRTFLHYDWSLIRENGMYDDDTIEAVKAFQQNMYFTVTGELDIDTEIKIDDLYRWSLQAEKNFRDDSLDYKTMNRPTLETDNLSARTLLMVVVLFFSSMTVFAQSSADILSYINKYKDIALDQEKQYGIPATITLAQGILESGAGRSGLTRNANNHFGIKAFGGWTGPIYQAWDDEPNKSRFRVYSSAAESFRDHSLFLKNNSRYRSLFSKSVYDYRGWAIGLQKAGYATATTYAMALIGFIDSYKLYNLNGGVKLRAGKTVVITRKATATQKATFDASCQADDDELSEEEEAVANAVKRYVVDINDVRCTIMYPGMTLSSISMKYDIPKEKLLEYNEVASEKDIHEGDIVFIAKKKNKYTGAQDFYRVKKGDTLYGISQEFGIKYANLAKMNNKDIFSQLKEGEKIQLK
ncbi:MAG: glucosaminidase domain-containing protein [Prevotella sp.]|nr:glucosaminidase domain-containing protein [Prevotella sp.]MBQ7440860.1 glucosaminidase domain-containing protein [Prevotella sp.]MBQ9222193.1 glucosaminidase domain-containing protein [Prevotella sp.]